MALSFGVTVLPDPPYTRFLELIRHAEANGFHYGWTYDSHVLWQESFPLLTMAVQATTTMKFGHCVTNPGTREPTVLASGVRDAARHLRRAHGHGHRPRRLGRALHRPASPSASRSSSGAAAMIKDFMNGREVRVERQGAEARVGAAGAAGDPNVGGGLRAEGARGRGPGRRRRDHPARRPGDHPVDHGDRPRGSGRGGARPGRSSSASSARRATSRTTSLMRASRCAGSRRWSRTTSWT